MIFDLKREPLAIGRAVVLRALFLGGLPNEADEDALPANCPGINSA
jgi:adenine-specific DNA methylase